MREENALTKYKPYFIKITEKVSITFCPQQNTATKRTDTDNEMVDTKIYNECHSSSYFILLILIRAQKVASCLLPIYEYCETFD